MVGFLIVGTPFQSRLRICLQTKGIHLPFISPMPCSVDRRCLSGSVFSVRSATDKAGTATVDWVNQYPTPTSSQSLAEPSSIAISTCASGDKESRLRRNVMQGRPLCMCQTKKTPSDCCKNSSTNPIAISTPNSYTTQLLFYGFPH